MGRHVSVLEKALPHVDLFVGQPDFALRTPPSPGHRAYEELATKLFSATPDRRVLAFTAVHHGEGVTRTVRGLAAELIRVGRRIAVLNGALQHVPIAGMPMAAAELESHPPILGVPLGAELGAELNEGPARIASLRSSHDAILLDCGPLENSVDILRLASVTDGVVVIVGAGRTSKQQVDRAIGVIGEAGGSFLGFVLNRRRYPIPGWLYRRF
jgi:Mrp family chromosome partitioning ATPase